MDLSSMLNNEGPVPERRAQRTPPADASRLQLGHLPPQGHTGYGAPRPDQHTPGVGHPVQYGQPGQHVGLTPIHTPSHSLGGGQYPFPSHPSQSPGPSAVGQSYRSHESHAVISPSSRPSSHGHLYTQQQMSPSQGPAGGPPHGLFPTSSHSPTPSSHHSHTPMSVRQSPLSAVVQLPHHQQSATHSSNHSQPSTPLGPPQTMPRTTSQPDRSSPYHGRTVSSTPNGLLLGSPAHLQPGFLHPTEPQHVAHARPSPQRQTTVEYPERVDREGSLSVSPRTKLPSRTASLQSQSNGHMDPPSARSSVQPPGIALPYADTTAARSPSVDATRQSQPPVHYGRLSHGSPESSRQASQSDIGTRNPVNELPAARETEGGKMVMHRPDATHPLTSSPLVTVNSSPDPQTLPLQHPSNAMKRAADSELLSVGSSKKPKARHASRPIWAQLDPMNPRYQGDSTSGPQSQPSMQPVRAASEVRATPAPTYRPQANGTHADVAPSDLAIDSRLLRTRRILGPWEPCMCPSTPAPGMLLAVQDWLWLKLSELREVGNDPREGTIEIEAKIGTLIDTATDQRLNWPMASPVVLREDFNKNLRFESQMVEQQHMAMNKFLNKTLQDTLRKENEAPSGRVPMIYKHIYETDSFQSLSAAGFQVLPPAIQRRVGRELKVRTTIDDKTKQVVARIVKVHVANLHIYSPTDPYDCRITINLEVNLNRPDLDPDALIEPAKDSDKPMIDRQKDRLSYKHLAYSIDLTKVQVKGLGPQYELELEVDAGVLRKQMELISAGEESAYSAVVEGFLDNATYLMRNRP